MANQYEFTN